MPLSNEEGRALGAYRKAALLAARGKLEEACPVDAIVETHIFEYHFEERGKNVITKEELLAFGDKHEAEIAKRKAADAPYK